MFKKKLVALSAIMIAGLMTFQANVSADAVEEKPYLSLGADLSASQKSKVLELLGVKENELDQYKVVKVTNKDEHKYLDDYLDSSVIPQTPLTHSHPYYHHQTDSKTSPLLNSLQSLTHP